VVKKLVDDLCCDLLVAQVEDSVEGALSDRDILFFQRAEKRLQVVLDKVAVRL